MEPRVYRPLQCAKSCKRRFFISFLEKQKRNVSGVFDSHSYNGNQKEKVMLEKIKEFLHQDWTMTEKTLLIADLLLAGVLIGWLTAPFKGGLFSNNVLGSNNENYYDEDEFEDEED